MAPTVTINGKMVEDPLDKNDLFKKLNNELKKQVRNNENTNIWT